MSRDELLHPVFLNCCRYAVDLFWENLFEDMAYGITPYGTYIANDAIYCKAPDGSTVSTFIDHVDPEKTYNDFYDILFGVMNISSPEQRIQAQDAFKAADESSVSSRVKWVDIRKKNIKDILIDVFVSKMKDEYKLSLRSSVKLKTAIVSGLAFNTLDSSDVHMEDGYISSIDGIDFEHGKFVNNIDDYNDTEDVTELMDSLNMTDYTSKAKTKNLSDLWKRYLDDISKKSNKT